MKKITVTTALMWRICALTLGIWLAVVGYFTVTEAKKYIVSKMDGGSLDAAPARMEEHLDDWKYYMVYCRSYQEVSHRYSDDKFHDSLEASYETAAIYLDSDGNEIPMPQNWMIFSYQDEESWFSGDRSGYDTAYIDLDKTTYGQELYSSLPFSPHKMEYLANTYDDRGNVSNIKRYTGYFQDGEFVLVAVDSYPKQNTAFYDPDQKITMGWLDSNGHLDWERLYEGAAPADRELVRIYTDSGWIYRNYRAPLWRDWQSFDDLESCLRWYLQAGKLDDVLREIYDAGGYAEGVDLWDAVIFREGEYTDTAGRRCRYAAAVRCRPMLTAMMRLTKLYIWTLLPLVAILVLLYLRLRREVAKPLAQVIGCMEQQTGLPEQSAVLRWSEPEAIRQGYGQLHGKILDLQNEKRQLHAALDYAKDAEQDRRELVSGITHELKTPLAVIHSYAEGLRCDINAEKRDQYLQVILEETERMDAMVLEMLDLSRLEAGKVRLSVDQFRLLERTRGIMDRLAPLLEEKSLKVAYPLAEDVTVTADESRICQVIENLATNAIKFAPEGGTIWIETFRTKDGALFSIENEGEGIPEEALERIFQSFYRTEASRTTKGTGLGLAIAKSVIDLHGGTIRASNTQTGVQFSFTLP